MDVSTLLLPLNLDKLDQEWVQDIWYREFFENVDLPRDYDMYLDEIDFNDILHNFTKATKKWLDDGEAETPDANNVDKTWRYLVNTIKHKELTALLFHLIQKGQKHLMNVDFRVGAILAARTYFTMLMIPGSGVYRIFHAQMYIQCLTCFKFPIQIFEQNQYFSDSDEINLLNRQLKSLLNDLHILIYNVNLKSGDNDCVEETICCLVEFIGNTDVDSRLNLDKLVLTRLQELALQCIDIFIQGEEDEEPDNTTIRLIFKALLPKFTSLIGSKKSLSLWRASGVTYCGALLLKYGAIAMPGFICLLQHLCCNSEGMERIDNRSGRVRLVVGLLSLMPLKPYKELLQWIVKLSRNTKSQLRLFAVEVLGCLVSGQEGSLDQNTTNLAIHPAQTSGPVTQNQTPVQEIGPDNLANGENPIAPSAEISQNQENSTQNLDPSTESVPSTSSQAMCGEAEPIPSTSNQALAREMDQDLGEESQAVLNIPAQHQKVAHRDLLRVVGERCQDVSSTVRTKAVSILAAYTIPHNPIMMATIKEVFENEEGLFQLAVHKLKDERVTVRRTAMTLVENLFNANEALMTKENLEPLVGLCRDTSMMVRCAAVSCLTGLANKWASPLVLDAWLSGPLNQLSDPEIKVQDLVVENLRVLLLAPLSRYSETNTLAARRPWLLLAAITRKNMRRHLARGISKIASNSKHISYHVVDLLYTHIGTENNFHCWVLLSCVARHVQVSDINFVLDYYNDLTPEQLFGDVRLVSLVLEVLREWARCIKELEAIMLQQKLVAALRGGSLPGAGARGAVALCAALSRTHHADPHWASTLMREGELKMLTAWKDREVQGGGQIQGAALLTVADLALVSERRPSQEFLELLLELAGSFNIDQYDDVSVYACAVAALGKLSVRERSTAGVAAPLCARLLSTPSSPLALKVNAMCVLADICTRFTSIVEPMLPSVCACLGSPTVAVRRCAAQLVTQLLVGDFLRLRGSLYFHYFPLICDPDEAIRDVANYYILNCLVQRNKNILYHHFVECIFYYNRFEGHEMYGKFHVTEEEKRLFTLQGEEKRPIRLTIYDLMLAHMSDIQRLNTQVKLCKEAGQVGEAGEAGAEVLRDALAALRKAARPPQAKQQTDDMATRVTTNIISQKMKLNVVEMVVPTVMRLHRKLRASSSPLVPELVAYACDLMRDYKQEITELFEADTEFMREIKTLQANSVPSASTSAGLRSSKINNIPAAFGDDTLNNAADMYELEEEEVTVTPISKKSLKNQRSDRESRKSGHSRTPRVKRALNLAVQ